MATWPSTLWVRCLWGQGISFQEDFFMKVQILNRLNEKQLKKVRALLDACRDYEPITLTPPLTADSCFQPSLPCFYLLYENNELVSFLSLFLPDQYYGEAMGFTHPMARQRGYFKQLWNEALIKLDDYIEDMELLFVTDGNSADAQAALDAMEGEYQYSEYILEKDMEAGTGTEENMPQDDQSDCHAALCLRRIQPSDQALKQCADIHEAIFCDGRSASEAFIKEMFETPDTATFLAYHAARPARQPSGGNMKEAGFEHPVGIFHLTEWESGTYLAGFGILPEWQGQGLGTALLHAVPSCLKPGHTLLSLQVGSLNEAAFALYQKEGFREVSHREYYY